jgi:hypothetical protein
MPFRDGHDADVADATAKAACARAPAAVWDLQSSAPVISAPAFRPRAPLHSFPLSPAMTARQTFANLYEWLFRASAMRDARATLAAANGARTQAARQARLLVEVARRVAEPVERLPSGCRAAVMVGLYREAVGWALLAGRPDAGRERPDPATLWREEPPERLLAAATDAATVEAVKETLFAAAPLSLDVSQEDAERARTFAEALVLELEAPQRRVQHMLRQRWLRLVFTGVILLGLVVGAQRLLLGPNLAEGKPFRTSSSWSGCATDAPCRSLLFHTNPETNPWVEFDLGAPKSIRQVEIANRVDCCRDRAVPLIVEVGNDQARWTEVARRDTEFATWTAKFSAQTARYVRLRIPRDTALHLDSVVVR